MVQKKKQTQRSFVQLDIISRRKKTSTIFIIKKFIFTKSKLDLDYCILITKLRKEHKTQYEEAHLNKPECIHTNTNQQQAINLLPLLLDPRSMSHLNKLVHCATQ